MKLKFKNLTTKAQDWQLLECQVKSKVLGCHLSYNFLNLESISGFESRKSKNLQNYISRWKLGFFVTIQYRKTTGPTKTIFCIPILPIYSSYQPDAFICASIILCTIQNFITSDPDLVLCTLKSFCLNFTLKRYGKNIFKVNYIGLSLSKHNFTLISVKLWLKCFVKNYFISLKILSNSKVNSFNFFENEAIEFNPFLYYQKTIWDMKF